MVLCRGSIIVMHFMSILWGICLSQDGLPEFACSGTLYHYFVQDLPSYKQLQQALSPSKAHVSRLRS